jgi:hypothetical protein
MTSAPRKTAERSTFGSQRVTPVTCPEGGDAATGCIARCSPAARVRHAGGTRTRLQRTRYTRSTPAVWISFVLACNEVDVAGQAAGSPACAARNHRVHPRLAALLSAYEVRCCCRANGSGVSAHASEGKERRRCVLRGRAQTAQNPSITAQPESRLVVAVYRPGKPNQKLVNLVSRLLLAYVPEYSASVASRQTFASLGAPHKNR